jgi:hypothetical protein
MKWLFAIIVFFCCKQGVAQFNDSTHYYARFASTGVINKTDGANSYVWSNFATYNIDKRKYFLNTAASYIYGENDGGLTNNDFATTASFDFLKRQRRLYYWALVNYDKSYSLEITNRLQAGAGLAYKFIKDSTGRQEFTLSDGFLYETSNLVDSKLGKDVYQTIRNSFRIRYHFIVKDILVIDGNNFFQPSIVDISDYAIRATNTLSVKVYKILSITAAQTYNKVSRTDRENLLLTFGVTVDKYF